MRAGSLARAARPRCGRAGRAPLLCGRLVLGEIGCRHIRVSAAAVVLSARHGRRLLVVDVDDEARGAAPAMLHGRGWLGDADFSCQGGRGDWKRVPGEVLTATRQRARKGSARVAQILLLTVWSVRGLHRHAKCSAALDRQWRHSRRHVRVRSVEARLTRCNPCPCANPRPSGRDSTRVAR